MKIKGDELICKGEDRYFHYFHVVARKGRGYKRAARISLCLSSTDHYYINRYSSSALTSIHILKMKILFSSILVTVMTVLFAATDASPADTNSALEKRFDGCHEVCAGSAGCDEGWVS